MCGSLCIDFFNQPKYLFPGNNIHLKLIRNNNGLCLKGTGKVHLTSARLYVRRVKVHSSVLMGHQIGLQKQNAVYPITQSRVITFSLPQTALSFYKDQLFGDMKLPKFVVVAFQSTAATSGTNTSATMNSSVFKHCSVQ